MIVLVIVFVLILCYWSFNIGIIVGKSFMRTDAIKNKVGCYDETSKQFKWVERK